RAASMSGIAGLSDAQLLERFSAWRDQSAFELLVWRHGGLVFSVCRRMLKSEQDAEDAFQATFLSFVRGAATVSKRESIGSWLYKVAYRIALRARRRSMKRARFETTGMEFLIDQRASDSASQEIRRVLDEEVNRLPAKYRLPFVLCHIEGKTYREAAQQLGLAAGTISSRLGWAIRRLRIRLGQRGLAVSSGLIAAAVSKAAASASVPPVLVDGTVK